MIRDYQQTQAVIDEVSVPAVLRGSDAAKSFWVLERDGAYVTLRFEPRPEGGFFEVCGWTKDIREARHWPAQIYADQHRARLYHPFWMANCVEHAMISADEYADGLASEIDTLRSHLASANARVGVLESALKPFSAHANTFIPDEAYGDDRWVMMPLGDCRKARAALNPATGDKP